MAVVESFYQFIQNTFFKKEKKKIRKTQIFQNDKKKSKTISKIQVLNKFLDQYRNIYTIERKVNLYKNKRILTSITSRKRFINNNIKIKNQTINQTTNNIEHL